LERVKQAGHLWSISLDLTSARIHAADALLRGVHGGALRNGPTDSSDDAALAQLPILGYPNRELCESTVLHITRELAFRRGSEDTGFFYRYVQHDDFGKLEGAFVICSFWIAQALARLGRIPEARTILNHVLDIANHVGLLSEHFIPATNTQCGTLPQAYSHVGLINGAFAVSPPWNDVL
jgi:GH15 family glucan-1,4-alpha-glucosidase